MLSNDFVDLFFDRQDTGFEFDDVSTDIISDEMATRGFEAVLLLAFHGDEIEASGNEDFDLGLARFRRLPAS